MRGGSTIWINGLSLMCNHCFISACRNLSSPACSLQFFHHHPHLYTWKLQLPAAPVHQLRRAKTHSWNTKLSTPPLLVPHHRLEIPDLTSIQGEEHQKNWDDAWSDHYRALGNAIITHIITHTHMVDDLFSDQETIFSFSHGGKCHGEKFRRRLTGHQRIFEFLGRLRTSSHHDLSQNL